MNSKSKKEENYPYLILLQKVPKVYLTKEEVASALQSFETSLYLIAEGLWPTVLLLIWESCEKLLRVTYIYDSDYVRKNRLKDDVNNQVLQERYFQSGKISRELHEQALRLRRARNEIAHKGYTPKDDRRCIDLYFNAGFPYFNSLVQDLMGCNISELSFDDEYSGGWLWSVYKDTRKVLTKRIGKRESDLYGTLLFLRLAVDQVWKKSTAHRAVFLQNEIESIISEHFQNEEWEIHNAIRNRYIKQIGGKNDCVELPGFSCPICGEDDILAGVTWKEDKGKYVLKSIKAFGCIRCKYIYAKKKIL